MSVDHGGSSNHVQQANGDDDEDDYTWCSNSSHDFEDDEETYHSHSSFLNHHDGDDILQIDDYMALSNLTNKICHHLTQIPNEKVKEMRGIDEIREDMQALTKLVLEESCTLLENIKQTFLEVAKTYYYRAYFDAHTVDLHMFKVLFEPVV